MLESTYPFLITLGFNVETAMHIPCSTFPSNFNCVPKSVRATSSGTDGSTGKPLCMGGERVVWKPFAIANTGKLCALLTTTALLVWNVEVD